MIRGILLAGGASTRFGSPKLLHPFAPGLTLGEACARNLIAGVGNALAVVRDGDEALAARLRESGCEILLTERAREGMGASLAAGVEGAREADGWVIALADMPRIANATYRAIDEALRRGAPIAAPVLAASGERGHPVGFARSFGAELRGLTGDAGARSILERHHAKIVEIRVDDPGIVFDIDRPGDVA